MWIWHTTAMELITFTAIGAHHNSTFSHSLYNELVFYGIICWSKWLTSFCENTDILKLSLVGSTASLKCQKEPAATIPLGQIYPIIIVNIYTMTLMQQHNPIIPICQNRLYIYIYTLSHTVNREIFVYENIHVLNIRVNKFSRVPHENILIWKFVKLKLLCMYHQLSDY